MLIATLPPYVRHRLEIIRHPSVDALRFNTIMPIGEDRQQVLAELKQACGPKPLWIDLKTRQLRITGFAYLPLAFVDLSHKISVNLPARVCFKDCTSELVRIVNGDRLILAARPARVVGAGEPINILDPSLRIQGFLTNGDREYIEAARGLGLHRYLLSFVEQQEDIEQVLALDPEAEIIAKIESLRGLEFVREAGPTLPTGVRLMAARDDLYINMGEDPTAIFAALELIIHNDPRAIVASRVLTSLEHDERVSLGDLADLRLMHQLGYRASMLSDGLCFSKKAFRRAMDVWDSYHARASAPGAGGDEVED